jgi:3',5'-cyclic AMP phosphodiesterase CpdA
VSIVILFIFMSLSRRLVALGFSLTILLASAGCGDDLGPRGDPTRPSWSIVVLPDTQYYAQLYPSTFVAQLAWIARSAQSLNLQFVVHLGDVTETSDPSEWQVARTSFDAIEGMVPYMILPGNHDYVRDAKRVSPLSRWFPASALQPPSVAGLFEPGLVDNSYQTMAVGQERWLLLGLEWGPRDVVLDWANQVIANHPDHQVLIATHAYLNNNDARFDWNAEKAGKQRFNPHAYADDGRWPEAMELNDGEEIWDKLVSRHRNIRLVLCGHVPHDGVGRLTSTGADGAQVHQLLSNYQGKELGGAGYLRILRFFEDEIEVRTYSPTLDRELYGAQHLFYLPR